MRKFKSVDAQLSRAGFRLASILPLCVASTAWGIELNFADGEVAGRLDTAISYGATWRTEDPDSTFAAISPDGTYIGLPSNRTQANKNDGNRNFDNDSRADASVVKLNALLELTYDKYGMQVSGFAFHDQALYEMKGDTGSASDFINGVDAFDRFDNRKLGERAEDYAMQDARLSSAYVWGDFEIGGKNVNVRFGEQVISWGEALFMQDGINQVNPADLSALRLPGAEIKDALLPLPMLYVQSPLTENLSAEAFYQFGWGNSEPDPVGTLYSTTDAFFGRGAEAVIVDLDFFEGDPALLAAATGLPQAGIETKQATESLIRAYNAAVRLLNPADPMATRLSNNKLDDVEPSTDGQFGLAFRYMAPSLNNTEFGLYFMNYHSRKPHAGAVLGEADGVRYDEQTCAAAKGVLATLDPALAEQDCAVLNGLDPSTTAGSIVGAMNTFHYLDSSSYFLAYEEDIQVYGFTFSTNIGETSFAGEIAYRPEMPFLPEVGDNLIALNAINAKASLANGGTVADGDFGQHITSDSIINDADGNGLLSAGDTIELVDYSEAVNISLLAIQNFGPALWSDGLTGILELGGAWMGDLKSGVNYAAEGALGTAVQCANVNDPSTCSTVIDSDLGLPVLAEGTKDGYLDEFSWGYRLVFSAEYNDVFAGVTLNPQIRFAHDVSGNSVVGGNFVEGRQSASAALNATYADNWGFTVGYNAFWGAENRNQLQDRDNITASVKYSF